MEETAKIKFLEGAVPTAVELTDGGRKKVTWQLKDGTTACVAVVKFVPSTTANVGDSRCVIGGGSRKRPKATRCTTDHKPELVNEARRVQNAGGAVEIRDACLRPCGTLRHRADIVTG